MKVLTAAFIIALLLTTLAVAVHLGTVQASTAVNGIISSDTTWTQTNSPYSLSGNVLVKDGVTLTIEAGATVNLNSYYILVNGTLQAKGTSTDKILINGIDGSPPPIPLGSSLAISFTYGITINGDSTIENAIINQVRLALGSSNKVNNSTVNGFVSVGQSSFFTNNIATGVVFAGDNSQILNNNIKGGIETEYGSPTISNNEISGGGSGIWSYLSENVVISGNVITGCGQGIFANGGNGIIDRNFIAGNTEGITVNYGSTATIKENTIEGNQIGIQLPSAATPIINYNNLQKNSYNVYLGSSANLDATNNWWGTTNESAISQSIYDFKNDFNLGTVNFVPFLTEPNPNAPAIPASTPTPPPSSPSPTLSPNPTPTPSQEPQQTEQTEIIIIAAIVVAVISAGLGFLIYLIKRK